MNSKLLILLLFLIASCSKKTVSQYIETSTTHYDTIDNVVYVAMDTLFSNVPCDSFTQIIREKDTVYIRTVKKVVETKTVIKRDTIYRTPIVNQTVKINNKGGQIGTGNISEKTKKGDNITGDGNTITKPATKKGKSWFWIFIAGNLCWMVVQNVVWPLSKRFIPFANAGSKLKNVFKIFTS